MSTKKALKSIRGLIESGEYQTAVNEATEVLKSLESKDGDAAQVLVFRGLALTHLDRKDEAEKCYIHAYKLQPENPLASVGLRKLYEKEEQWQKLARLLEVTIQRAYDNGDPDACVAALQELLVLRQERGPEDELYGLLHLLLPSSPLVPFLQAISAPQGSFTPFPAPIYPPRSLAVLPTLPGFLPHVIHLLSSLPLLLNLLIRAQGLVHQKIEAQVKAGRTRLGAGPEKEVRKRVEGEVLGGPLGVEMIELLREVGSHAGVEESVRRDVEVKEFDYWRKLVGCLPAEDETIPDAKTKETKPKGKGIAGPQAQDDTAFSQPDLFKRSETTRPTKADALSRADGLAKGFILLGIASPGAEEGWTWVIEGSDEPTIFYDLELLHKFANAFPESSMTDFIDDYCRWFRLPLPQSEESDITPDTAPRPEEKKKKGWSRSKKINARERRRLRRVAHRAGNLSEDIDQEERDELVASMTKLLEKLPRSIFAHRVMARISVQEEDWANAVGYAEKARILVKELEAERGVSMPQASLSLDTSLGIALVPYFPPKHHSRATRLLNGVLNIDSSNIEARFARGQICQTALKWAQAREHFQKIVDSAAGDQTQLVSAKEEVAWCLVNEGRLEDGRQILEEIVELRDARWEETKRDDEAFPRARAWWRLGRTEWLVGDDESRAHAEEWFMASIRALPTYAPAYTSLGIAYLSATPPDDERALKCFQKAFELDATEVEAAQRLAEGYADDDEWALVRLVANRVMEGEGGVEGVKGGDVMGVKGRLAPKNGWAWKALGSTEMHYRNYAKAAQAYQIALRADPDDSTTWTQLGESYARCGRHMAGLKALQKALELDPAAWIAWYDIGDIHTQLGSFEAAIEAFEQVTTMTRGQGVTAKMAESYLSLGRAASAAGYRERARRAFEHAIELACEVLAEKVGHRPWGWKVIGDACFELGDVETGDEVLRTALDILVEDDADKRALTARLPTPEAILQAPDSRHLASRMAVFAYTYRSWLLKNEPRVITMALYDLASALHALSSLVEEDEKKTCQKAAIGCIRNALDRDAGDERLWNALAVLCGEGGEEVAQHAFVISLELYAKDPMVWTNLGYLYLRLDDLDLASECFLKAQTTDPDYARAWLGQGLISQKQGDKAQAGALFAHAVILSAGALLEADLASAMLAFEPFLDSSSPLPTSDLHSTAFTLRHYVHHRPSDAAATHLFGLICERIGLIDEAADAFDLATQTLEHEFESSESPEVEKRYLVALVNLARVKLALGEYDGALKSSTDALELARSQPSAETWITFPRTNVQCLVIQGVAYFWLGQIEPALTVFDEAYTEAGQVSAVDGTSLKENVAVLLARTLWGIGGGEARDTAKTHLMECLSSESPSVAVVTTLAAIALISSDDDLIEASVSELCSIAADRQRNEDPRDRTTDILVSSSFLQGDAEAARGILEKAIHNDPANTAQRIKLAKLLISSGDASIAEAILDMPVFNGSSSERSRLLQLRGLSKMMGGDPTGLKDVQKAIKVCPWDAEAWKAVSQV